MLPSNHTTSSQHRINDISSRRIVNISLFFLPLKSRYALQDTTVEPVQIAQRSSLISVRLGSSALLVHSQANNSKVCVVQDITVSVERQIIWRHRSGMTMCGA